MKLIISSFLVLLVSVVVINAQTEVVVKVGRTKSLAGNQAPISSLQNPGFKVWLSSVEGQGGIISGGVKYIFQMQEYNDASDEELMAILYERLITVDNVSFLFLPPFTISGLPTLAKMAEAAGIITINLNALGTLLLGVTQPRWVFSTYPPINLSPQVCGRTLRAAGATTYIIATVEGDLQQLQPFFDGTFSDLGMTKVRADVITKEMIADPSKLDPLIKAWKASGADVWMGGGIFQDNIPLLNRIRLQRYEPKSLYFWAAPDTSSGALPYWQIRGVLFSTNFERSLEFPDAYYGNAANYSDLARAVSNTSGGSVDSVVAISGELIADAVRRAGSIDPNAVRAAMLTTNITTMLGPAIFSDTLSLSLSYYCFQGGGDKIAVLRPSLNSSFAKDIVYPVTGFSYAPGFFNKNNHKKTIIIALASTGGFLVLVALVALGGYLYFRSKFHLVLVQRGTNTEEW